MTSVINLETGLMDWLKLVLNGDIEVDEDSTVWVDTAEFSDGHIIDVKVCSGEEGDTPWCEAVLYKRNDDGSYSQVCCTDCDGDVDGPWTLTHNGVEYTALVVVGNK